MEPNHNLTNCKCNPNAKRNLQLSKFALSSIIPNHIAFRECYHCQLALAANSDPVWHISSLSSMSMACSCGLQHSVYFLLMHSSVEESIRIVEDRDKWRKYVHSVVKPEIEDG